MTMHQNFTDAMQASFNFAVQQTSHIEAEVYRTRYPELDYASLIPVDTSANPWVKSVTYRSLDGAGTAGWINGNADDVPVVGMQHEQHETEVHTAAIGYDFGLEEVNQARLLGIALDSEKAMLARKAAEQMTYNVAFTGDTSKGWTGLFNNASVPAATATADGTGSTATWSTKTPDQIIRDVNAALIGMGTATNQTEMADTLILPVERLQTIASKRLTDTSMTVLEFIERANVYTAQSRRPLTIVGKRGMLAIGSGSTARMVAYRRSPEVLKMHVPMPHMFLPMQERNLRFIVPGIFRLGGLDIRLPKAVTYVDGI